MPPSGMGSLSKRILQMAPQSCLSVFPMMGSSLPYPRKPVPSPGQFCLGLKLAVSEALPKTPLTSWGPGQPAGAWSVGVEAVRLWSQG